VVLILREMHFPNLCREFITEQASPIIRSAVAIRTLLTAKVDKLLYFFNWYTIYEDCRRRVTCTHDLGSGVAEKTRDVPYYALVTLVDLSADKLAQQVDMTTVNFVS